MAEFSFVTAQQGISAPGPLETRQPRGPNALQQAAAGLDAVAGQLAQARNAKEELAVQRILAEAREAWNERALKAQAEAPAGAPNFANTLLSGFDDDIKQRGAELSRERQADLQARAANLRANLRIGAMEFEVKASNEKLAQDFDKVATLAINGVRSNPARYAAAVEEIENGINALPLGDAIKGKLRTQYRQQAAVASVQAVSDRDPRAALKLLNNGTYDADLSPEKKSALINAAEVDQRQRDAEARREARERQMLAAAQAQGVYQDQIAAYRETGRGLMPDKEFADLMKAAYPKVADRYIRTAEDERDFFTVRQSVILTSREEDAKALADAAPKVDPSAPAGLYESQVRRRDQLARAISAKWEAIAQDPAAWVLGRSPKVAALYQPDAQPGATAEQVSAATAASTVAGTRALLETQASLGVPDFARRALTRQQADSTVARLNAAGDEEKANILAGLRGQYGEEYWPLVMRDLQEAKMSPAAAVLSRLDLGGDAAARVDLSAAFKVGVPAMEKLVPEVERKAARDRLMSLYTPLRTTMFAQGGAAADVFTSEFDAAWAMTLHRMSRYGESGIDAAKNVHKLLISDKMEFSGTLSAPKGQLREVVSGLGAFQDTLTPDALQPLNSTRPGASEADRRAETTLYAKRGHFVNNETSTGYILRLPNGAPARWADGRRVEISLDDARRYANGDVPKGKKLMAIDGKVAGLIEAGNIDLNTRPAVRNPDGSVSSVRSMSVNIDGAEVLIPTVSDDGRVMTDDEAVVQYEKSGRHLGKFDTPRNANAYAELLHKEQEARGRKAPGLILTVPGMDPPPRLEGNR